MGDKGALGGGFGQRHTQPRVLALAGRLGHLHTLGLHGCAREVAETPAAMPAQVHHRQTIASGGGHHVEAAAGFEAGRVRQHVTTGGRQRVEGHDQVNDDLAGVQQSRH